MTRLRYWGFDSRRGGGKADKRNYENYNYFGFQQFSSISVSTFCLYYVYDAITYTSY